ncbi:fused MFS/spermidine synthase [Stenotrophomonas rhizophila]
MVDLEKGCIRRQIRVSCLVGNLFMGTVVTDTASRRGLWLLVVFVISGFAGLIYQSIWTQYLGLFLGHSSLAQSLVLILFMGGMAIGAWLVSLKTSLLRRPLLTYAVIEVIIGAWGLGFDGIFHGMTGWAYTNLMPGLEGGALAASRWGLATILVLPQCVLLGATFPLMSAGYMRLQPQAQGQVLAGLYFSNSLGAAFGALASTYLLVPMIGLPGAVLTAGVLNVLVALLVYPIAREYPLEVAQVQGSQAPCPPAATVSKRTIGVILLIAAATGAASFVYEITWVRMLSLALGTTLHSFELMLAAFIAGIAFGGLWLRKRADRMTEPLRVAGWVQVWMGLAALASMFVYARAFDWVGWLMGVIVRNADGYGLYNVASAAISLMVMFPAAFFAGMTLPLLTLALLRSSHGEKSIGQAYAFNTVGAIVGVLAAVHVLMPVFGLKYALLAAAVVDIALGVVLLARPSTSHAPNTRIWSRPALHAAALGVVGVVCAIAFVRFDPLVLSSSVYRHGSAKLQDDTKMLFFRDGQTATVSLYESEGPDGPVRSIATNGKVDAGMAVSIEQRPSNDESTMVLLGALPLALRDGYEHIGVIGFGSGLTTHTLLGDARVKKVDTVEIEPAMVEGAQLFGSRVSRAFRDPRSRVIIDDAKAHFAANPLKYDLIISEPSNPWVGGTASLFGEEFYTFVPKHLTDDGLFVQWLQLYEITPELVTSVLGSMLSHFSDVHVYLANNSDLILVASPRGKVPELRDGVFEQPSLKAELARIGVGSLADLQATFVMDDAALRAYVPLYPSPRNSDFFPFLKLRAPTARFEQARVLDFDDIATAPWPLTAAWGGQPLQSEDVKDLRLRLPLHTSSKRMAAAELYLALAGDGVQQRMFASELDWARAEALRGMANRCAFGSGPDAVRLVLNLAAETIPFLGEEDRLRLWEQRDWLKCQSTNEDVTVALDFVAAASSGRQSDVLRLGQQLIHGPSGRLILADSLTSYYVFGALQFAAWREGDSTLARQLKDAHWQALPDAATARASLRLVTWRAALGRSTPDAAQVRSSEN